METLTREQLIDILTPSDSYSYEDGVKLAEMLLARVSGGQWVKKTINFDDALFNASMENEVELMSNEELAGRVITSAFIKMTEAFAAPSAISLALGVSNAEPVGSLLESNLQGGSSVEVGKLTHAELECDANAVYDSLSASDLKVKVKCITDNLDTYTAGSVDIYFKLEERPDIEDFS